MAYITEEIVWNKNPMQPKQARHEVEQLARQIGIDGVQTISPQGNPAAGGVLYLVPDDVEPEKRAALKVAATGKFTA